MVSDRGATSIKLTAGVVENGQKTAVRVGTPQGAVISPLLANIYLHYVFDLWTHMRRMHAPIPEVGRWLRRVG